VQGGSGSGGDAAGAATGAPASAIAAGSLADDAKWQVPFDPSDPKRLCWDLLVIVPLLVYLMASLPFSFAFNYEPAGAHARFEVAVDLLFCLDIGVSFGTGLLLTDTGEESADEYVELGAAAVAKAYLKSWFLLDLLSGFPLGLITSDGMAGQLTYVKLLKSGKALKALRVLRLFKLTKMMKLNSTLMTERRVDQLEELFQLNLVRSTFVLLSILLKISYIAHLLCCGWVAVGRYGDVRGAANWLDHQGFSYRDTERGSAIGDVYLTGVKTYIHPPAHNCVQRSRWVETTLVLKFPISHFKHSSRLYAPIPAHNHRPYAAPPT
jgi:hypothetical protein